MSLHDHAKKVKFNDNEHVKEVIEYDEESNDLDLDTIKSFRLRQSNALKEFDSEGSEEEEENEEEKQLNFDSDSNDEEEEESVVVDSEQVQFEPFNLKNDREEGNFDQNGFFVRKRDEEANQDRWMANFTQRDILAAKKAHERQQQKERLQQTKGQKSEVDLLKELAALFPVDPSESSISSVLDLIRSLKGKDSSLQQKPRAPLNKNRLKKQQQQQQANNDYVIDTSLNVEKMEKITELADSLMNYGNFDIYEDSKGQIMTKIKEKEGQ
jgi:CD2 antigen cytoplasmic tail-binding protein 2